MLFALTAKLVQFVDDVMDFTSSSAIMGKPALNDLKSGLATAPVLFAAEEFPELSAMIQRRFQNNGDVETAQRLVFQSRGIERTRDLAAHHATLAAEKVSFKICSYAISNAVVLPSYGSSYDHCEWQAATLHECF